MRVWPLFAMLLVMTTMVVAMDESHPFNKGWQSLIQREDTNGGYEVKNIGEWDVLCNEVEVHPGYFVKKIAVRTSANGIECQFPSGDKKKVVVVQQVVEPVIEPIEPICKDERFCEWCWMNWYEHPVKEYCSQFWMWGRYPKCKEVKVCEE